MKADAIVYTSRSGFTKKYAEMLGEMLNLSAYSLKDSASDISRKAEIIYLGWLFANCVKDFSKARKRYNICAVCGVGLCETGENVSEVRKTTDIPCGIPLFTLQGGFERESLKGINKLLISMIEKGLSNQKERSETDEKMLELIKHSADYTDAENLKSVIEWYRASD